MAKFREQLFQRFPNKKMIIFEDKMFKILQTRNLEFSRTFVDF